MSCLLFRNVPSEKDKSQEWGSRVAQGQGQKSRRQGRWWEPHRPYTQQTAVLNAELVARHVQTGPLKLASQSSSRVVKCAQPTPYLFFLIQLIFIDSVSGSGDKWWPEEACSHPHEFIRLKRETDVKILTAQMVMVWGKPKELWKPRTGTWPTLEDQGWLPGGEDILIETWEMYEIGCEEELRRKRGAPNRTSMYKCLKVRSLKCSRPAWFNRNTTRTTNTI